MRISDRYQQGIRMKATAVLRSAALLVSLLLTACGTLPEVKPFADATATIHSGMRSVGEAAVERVQQNIAYLSIRAEETNGDAKASFAESKRGQEEALKRLNNDLAVIVKVGGAFVDYADSLQGIVAAANSSADSARSFTTAVNKFATTLTGDPLITPAIASVASRLYKEFATYQASRSLEAAMEQATPIINEVAGELKKVVEKSQQFFSESARVQGYREVNNELKRKYGFDQSFRQQIITEREEAFKKISGDCTTSSCATSKEIENLKMLDQLYDRTQAFATERAAGMQKVDDYFARQRALLGRVGVALDAWREAHSSLLTAVKEKRQFSARQLIEVAQDIQEIIREGKNNGK
jgi:hypothetical protein